MARKVINRTFPQMSWTRYVTVQQQGSSAVSSRLVVDHICFSFAHIFSQEHKVSGLTPGCTYGILLKTATGRRQTRYQCRSFKFKVNLVRFPFRQPVFECVMTKPLPVQSFSCSTTSTSSVDLKWCPPERHKRLKAFNIVIQSRDAKVGQLVNHDFDLVATRSNGK